MPDRPIPCIAFHLKLLFFILALASICTPPSEAQSVLSDVIVNVDGVTFKNDPENPWQLTEDNYLQGNKALISPAPSSLSKESSITFTFEKDGPLQFLHKLDNPTADAFPFYINGYELQRTISKWRYFQQTQSPGDPISITIAVRPGPSNGRMIIDQLYLRNWRDYYRLNEFGGKLNFDPDFSWDDIFVPSKVTMSPKNGFTYRHLEADVESLEVENQYFTRDRISIVTKENELNFLTSNGTLFTAYFNYAINAFDINFQSWGNRVWDMRDNVLCSPLASGEDCISNLETSVTGPALVSVSLNHVIQPDDPIRASSDVSVYVDDQLMARNQLQNGPETIRVNITDGEHIVRVHSKTGSSQWGPFQEQTYFQYVELKDFNVIPGYSILFEQNDEGEIQLSPTRDTYAFGDQVTVKAIPKEGYRFVGWNNKPSEKNDSYTFRITEQTQIEAFFAPIESNPIYNYSISGHANWERLEGQTLNVRSPLLFGYQKSSLYIETPGPGTLAFELDEYSANLTKGHALNIFLNGKPYFDISNPARGGLNVIDLYNPKNKIEFFVTDPQLDPFYDYREFDYKEFEILNITYRPEYLLDTNSIGPGVISTQPNKSFFAPGEVATLTANSNPNASLLYWSGVDSVQKTVEVTMDRSWFIEATFGENANYVSEFDWAGFHWNTSPLPAPEISEWAGRENSDALVLSASKNTLDCFASIEVQGPSVFSAYYSFSSPNRRALEILIDSDPINIQSININWARRDIPIPDGIHQLKFRVKGGQELFGDSILTIDDIELLPGYHVIASVRDGTFSLSPNQDSYTLGESVQLTAIPDDSGDFLGWKGTRESENESTDVEIDDQIFLSGSYGKNLEAIGHVWGSNPDSILYEEDDYLYFRPDQKRSWLRTIDHGPGLLKFSLYGEGYSQFFSHPIGNTDRLHPERDAWTNFRIEVDEDNPVFEFTIDPNLNDPEQRHIKLKDWNFQPGYALEIQTFGCEVDGAINDQIFDAADSITLTATPSPGNRFLRWIVDDVPFGESPTLKLTIDHHTKVVALCTVDEIPFAEEFQTATPEAWRWIPSPETEGERILQSSRINEYVNSQNLLLTVKGPGVFSTVKSETSEHIGIWLDGEQAYHSNVGLDPFKPAEIYIPDGTHSLELFSGGPKDLEFVNPNLSLGHHFQITLAAGIDRYLLDQQLVESDTGSLSVKAGDSITLTAKAFEGYAFNHWLVDGVESFENPIRLTPTSDIELAPVYDIFVGEQRFTTLPTATHYSTFLQDDRTTLGIDIQMEVDARSGVTKTFNQTGWLSFEWSTRGFGQVATLLSNKQIVLEKAIGTEWSSERVYLSASEQSPVTITWLHDHLFLRNVSLDSENTLTGTWQDGVVEMANSKSFYQPGDKVTATATPSSGYLFGGWEGTYASLENPLTFEPYDWPILNALFYRPVDAFGYTWRISGNPNDETISSDQSEYIQAWIGGIEEGQSGRIGTSISGPGILSFWAEVDYQAPFKIYLDGIEQVNKAANTDLEFFIEDGEHTVSLEVFNPDIRGPATEAIAFRNFTFKPDYQIRIATDKNYTSISPLKDAYEIGDIVTIRAIPAAGNTFSHWSGEFAGSDPEVTIQITNHVTAHAHFKSEFSFAGIDWTKKIDDLFSIEFPYEKETPVMLASEPLSFSLHGPGTLHLEWISDDLNNPRGPHLVIKEGNRVLSRYQNPKASQWENLNLVLAQDRDYQLTIEGPNFKLRSIKYTLSHREPDFVDWVANHYDLSHIEDLAGLSLTIDADNDGRPSLYERMYHFDPEVADPGIPFQLVSKEGQLYFEITVDPFLFDIGGTQAISNDLRNWTRFDSKAFAAFATYLEDGSIHFSIPLETFGPGNAIFFTY